MHTRLCVCARTRVRVFAEVRMHAYMPIEDCAHSEYGGDIIKFAGDAVSIVFIVDDGKDDDPATDTESRTLKVDRTHRCCSRSEMHCACVRVHDRDRVSADGCG
jgi:class 3 adenylate cyclase